MKPDIILAEMYKQAKRLEDKSEEYKDIGIALADAERDFRVELSKKMLELKSEGIAISTCETLAKGDTHIANLRFERDKQQVILDACKKAGIAIDKKIEILRSDLSWQKADIHYIEQPIG